ncbi:hypothetical protein [Streptomyces gobiensis]|uniref:hypothetical protein n=1 Tax=Streptomyces gobiensis TaxID=2875706 RepID=UPI003BB01C03
MTMLTGEVLGAVPGVPVAVADGNGSLVMVLDSSGPMGDDDGSGSTRIGAARNAVGSVVDSPLDGYPTGLRLCGAGSRPPSRGRSPRCGRAAITASRSRSAIPGTPGR